MPMRGVVLGDPNVGNVDLARMRLHAHRREHCDRNLRELYDSAFWG